jgi:tetratricopeptide (TPR) repeat protein
LLEELQDAGPDTALEALEEAERACLIFAERSGREVRYRFVHELVRQTLGESISMPRRQRLHARAAEAIERLYGSNVDCQASVLAHHLYQAGASADLDKTIHYLMLAARLARTGAAHEEALAHMDNALSLLGEEKHPRKAELHAARAIALRSLARSAEAIEGYERAIAEFMAGSNLPELTEATLRLAAVHFWRAEGRRGRAALERAITLIGKAPSVPLHTLLLSKAVAAAIEGDMEAGFATLAEAKEVEAAVPDARQDGLASMMEARFYFQSAQIDKAEICAKDALARFRALGNLWREVETFEEITGPLWLGRVKELEPLLVNALSHSERAGHRDAFWAYKIYLAQMWMARGELERAEAIARETLGVAHGWGYLTPLVLAVIAHYRGQFDEAIEWSRRGLAIEPATSQSGQFAGALFWSLAVKGDSWASDALKAARAYLPVPGRALSLGACGCLAFVVEGLAHLGRTDEAAALEQEAEIVVANGSLCVYSQHLFRTTAGIASGCARNWTRAEEHYRTAIQQADASPYCTARPLARYWYAEMLVARGRADDLQRAHSLLVEAECLFESAGMPWYTRSTADRIALLEQVAGLH